jgi:biotin synthase-related radical SAM superfamily protein
LYKPYSVLLNLFEGFTNRKIAKMENIDEHTVGSYIKNYKANKLEGLNLKQWQNRIYTDFKMIIKIKIEGIYYIIMNKKSCIEVKE